MTNDEHREKCIEAVESAIISAIIDAGGTIDVRMNPVATSAFDAIAAAGVCVVPIESTEEMVKAGRKANLAENPLGGLYERIWQAMSAAGNLNKFARETRGTR